MRLVENGAALESFHGPLRRIAFPRRKGRFEPIAEIALRPRNVEADQTQPTRWRRREDRFPGYDGIMVVVVNRRIQRHMPDVHFPEIFQ